MLQRYIVLHRKYSQYFYNKWSITSRNYKSLYCTPVNIILYSYHTSVKIYIHIFSLPPKNVPRAPSGLYTEDYKIPSIPQPRPYVIKTDAFSLKTISHRIDSNSMTSPVYKIFYPLFLLILTFSCQGKYLGNVLRTPISQTIKICSERYSD